MQSVTLFVRVTESLHFYKCNKSVTLTVTESLHFYVFNKSVALTAQKCHTNCYKSVALRQKCDKSVTLTATKVSLCPRFVPILSPRGQSENHLRPYSPKRLGTSGTKFDPIS